MLLHCTFLGAGDLPCSVLGIERTQHRIPAYIPYCFLYKKAPWDLTFPFFIFFPILLHFCILLNSVRLFSVLFHLPLFPPLFYRFSSSQDVHHLSMATPPLTQCCVAFYDILHDCLSRCCSMMTTFVIILTLGNLRHYIFLEMLRWFGRRCMDVMALSPLEHGSNVGGFEAVGVHQSWTAIFQIHTHCMFDVGRRWDERKDLTKLRPTCTTVVRPSGVSYWMMLSTFCVHMIELMPLRTGCIGHRIWTSRFKCTVAVVSSFLPGIGWRRCVAASTVRRFPNQLPTKASIRVRFITFDHVASNFCDLLLCHFGW